jgi:hypothetical protein
MNFKPAIDFFEIDITGCCPVIKRISSVAFCKYTRFWAFKPRPALTTIFSSLEFDVYFYTQIFL